jgi:hypothetical protein
VGSPNRQALLSQEMCEICGKTIVELYITARMNLIDTKLGDFDDSEILTKMNVSFFLYFLITITNKEECKLLSLFPSYYY